MTTSKANQPWKATRRTLLARTAAASVAATVAHEGYIPARAQEGSPIATPVDLLDPVQTASGPVAGVLEGDVVAYKGIPYAAPPLGKLRWAPPQPVTPWTEPLAATDLCSDCMQVIGPESIETTPSEDCLCLNVWRPYGEVRIDALLPVLVWIHGGGYVGGGSSVPWYDGAAFARQGIVVVSFNYRLGRFGFFAPSALLNNTEGPYANYGYLDQIAALRWVQENISAFGGDPHRVTVMGESAGGSSVIHLMTSPAIQDELFHQAVILSGAGRLALLDRPLESPGFGHLSATTVDNIFSASVGVIGDSQNALDQLRTLPADMLVDDLDLEKLAQRRLTGGPLVGVPATDGEIVAGQPQDHFLDGTARSMPVIIGTTAIDVPTHFAPNVLHPLAFFGPDEDAARDAYGYAGQHFLGPKELIELNLSIGTDITMHEPAHFIANTMQDAGFDAWVYRFTYTAESTRPEQTQQVHAGELPFLFDNLPARYGDAVTQQDEATATAFNTYVANFVKQGNPNGAELPDWPASSPGELDVMHFTLDDGPVFEPDPRAATIALVAAAQQRRATEGS